MSDKNARFRSWYSVLVLVSDYVLINLVYVLLNTLGESVWGAVVSDAAFYKALLFLNISYLPVALANQSFHGQFVVKAEHLLSRALLTTVVFILVWLLISLIFVHERGSFLFLLSFSFLVLLGLALSWFVQRNLLKKYRLSGRNLRNVVIVGGGKNGLALYNEMTEDLTFGYRVLGFFDDNEEFEPAMKHLWLGRVDELEAYLHSCRVDEMYNTLPGQPTELNMNIIKLAERNFIRYYFVPGYFRFLKRRPALSYLGNMPIMSIRQEPLRASYNTWLKRLFDILFSLGVIIFIYPIVFLTIGVMIMVTSRGPLFFVQRRTGLLGKDFNCYKFRTMVVNNESNTLQAVANDPRITPIGRFLRNNSIDELPQFLNVLKGDMSVVGPRPHMLSHTEQYSKLIDKYMIRHLVKPGITGLAQVSGFRGETKELWKMERRVELDVEYIENWSLSLDIKIILQTLLLSLPKR